MHRTRPAVLTRAATLGLASALALVLTLSACGGSEADEPGAPTVAPSSADTPADGQDGEESPSATTPAPTAQEIDIRFDGDSVVPSGDRVQVRVGEPILFRVTAEEPGSLHVHSTPEAELSYGKGTTELEFTVDQPGVVEVESHALGVVIVQLEAR